ncbi:MAG: hypothetical protein FJ385_02330 [Verrucomicrobia bacterium]|nr:hypothetical protein [Verrucomicrobiota bacterium]
MNTIVVPSIVVVAMLVPGLVCDACAGLLRFDGEPAAVMTEDRWIDGPGNGRFALPWGIAEVQQSAGLSGSAGLAIAPGSAVAWERPSLVAPVNSGSVTITTHRLVAFATENDFRTGTNGTVIGTGEPALTAFSDGTSYFRVEPDDGRLLEFDSVTDWLNPAHAVRDHGVTFAGTDVRCAYARPGAYFLQLSEAAGPFIADDIIRFSTVADLVAGANGTVIANGAGRTIDALHNGSKVYKIDGNGDLQSYIGDSIFFDTTILGPFHRGTDFTTTFADAGSFYVQYPWRYTTVPENGAGVRRLSTFHLMLSDPDAAPPVTPAETLRAVLHVGADGLSALDGNGTGGGTWRLLAPTRSDRFHRVSILEDHLTGTYEVHLDAVRIASGLGFKNADAGNGLSFTRIESGSAAWIDQLAETQWLEGPADDSDGDGADDAAEWTAGTDAADPADVLRLAIQPVSPHARAGVLAGWRSCPGRSYTLEASGGVGAWSALPQGVVPGDGFPVQRLLQLPAGTDRWFLRLKVAHP